MNVKKAVIPLIIVFTAALLVFLNTPPYSKRMPNDINVILLTVDSLRPDHMSCYDYERLTCPNIDAIAEKGILFRRAFSQSAWTIPGIMSIFTSLHPAVHGVEKRGSMLDPAITTIFDKFREAGYAVPNISFLLSSPELSTIRVGPVEKEYFSEEDDDELFRWLDKNYEKKFFIWYLYRSVHLPYRPSVGSRSIFLSSLPEEDELSTGIKAVMSDAAVVPVGTAEFSETDRPLLAGLYDGEVRELDTFVGRLQARIKRFGIEEKTLIVITADHGEELMDHGFVGHASTMHSATLYDEIIRIPLIMSLPGSLPHGIEIREQVQQVDIMPTVLDIVDLPIPSGVQGRSLLPVLFDLRKQNESSHPVFAETILGGYQATEEMARTRMRSVRTDAWKLIETEAPTGRKYQLFNLLLDPREFDDVVMENTRSASNLKTLMNEWQLENEITTKAITEAAILASAQSLQTVCPEFTFPYDLAVLRHGERNGMIRASWTGSPELTYIIEYNIGTGVHHLTGTFVTFGNRRDFGPYSHELWSSLAVRNPWRVRISPDTQPRCWSEWIEFTFE